MLPEETVRIGGDKNHANHWVRKMRQKVEDVRRFIGLSVRRFIGLSVRRFIGLSVQKGRRCPSFHLHFVV